MLERVASYIWGTGLLVLLLGTGLCLSFRLRFFQFWGWKTILRRTFGSLRTKSGKGGTSLTQFQTFSTALAAAMGTGNILGVAAALCLGGAGAIFWMWVSALLGMALTGQWNWSYLPLHLCSINVFVCLYNTLTDQNWCKEELYALCIPGAALALLCPSWLDVPSWWTLINLHSISIHALLVLYPVLLVVRGYRPSARRAPQVLAFLFGSALPIYFLNKPLNTNFYFLNNPYGNVITSAFTRLLGEKYYICLLYTSPSPRDTR